MQLPERPGQNNFGINALHLLKGMGSVDGSPAVLYCPFRSLPVNTLLSTPSDTDISIRWDGGPLLC